MSSDHLPCGYCSPSDRLAPTEFGVAPVYHNGAHICRWKSNTWPIITPGIFVWSGTVIMPLPGGSGVVKWSFSLSAVALKRGPAEYIVAFNQPYFLLCATCFEKIVVILSLRLTAVCQKWIQDRALTKFIFPIGNKLTHKITRPN